MTDNLLAYRQVPLWALLDLNWAHRLNQGGYHNVGDVLDATPEALARNVVGIGPVRAQKIRSKVESYVSTHYVETRYVETRYADQYAEAFQIEPIDEVTPTLGDAVATIGSLVLIGGLFALTAWWLS